MMNRQMQGLSQSARQKQKWSRLIIASGFATVLSTAIFLIYTFSQNEEATASPLLDFYAEAASDNEVMVFWSTSTEKHNDYFTLEKSADGKEFSEVTRMNGSGNSSTAQSYSYTDKSPNKGISYYRLKQTDYDGKFRIYHTVSVRINNSLISELTIYPNPFNNTFVAEFSSDNEEEIWAQVINIDGALVHSEKTTSEKGHNVFRFTAPVKLSEGDYVFKLKNSKEILAAERIVLKK